MEEDTKIVLKNKFLASNYYTSATKVPPFINLKHSFYYKRYLVRDNVYGGVLQRYEKKRYH